MLQNIIFEKNKTKSKRGALYQSIERVISIFMKQVCEVSNSQNFQIIKTQFLLLTIFTSDV